MQLFIHTRGIDLTATMRRKTLEGLDLALDRIEDEIESIHVYLVDTNGPLLGGVDKACRIAVLIRKQNSIVVEDIDESVDVVIARATDRLGVVACQRADLFPKVRKRNYQHMDSDDSNPFLW